MIPFTVAPGECSPPAAGSSAHSPAAFCRPCLEGLGFWEMSPKGKPPIFIPLKMGGVLQIPPLILRHRKFEAPSPQLFSNGTSKPLAAECSPCAMRWGKKSVDNLLETLGRRKKNPETNKPKCFRSCACVSALQLWANYPWPQRGSLPGQKKQNVWARGLENREAEGQRKANGRPTEEHLPRTHWHSCARKVRPLKAYSIHRTQKAMPSILRFTTWDKLGAAQI